MNSDCSGEIRHCRHCPRLVCPFRCSPRAGGSLLQCRVSEASVVLVWRPGRAYLHDELGEGATDKHASSPRSRMSLRSTTQCRRLGRVLQRIVASHPTHKAGMCAVRVSERCHRLHGARRHRERGLVGSRSWSRRSDWVKHEANDSLPLLQLLFRRCSQSRFLLFDYAHEQLHNILSAG